MKPSLISDRDPHERLSVDDLAAQLGEFFLVEAIQQQQDAAARTQPSMRGVCTNCGGACLPQAVYCDTSCRDDHQHRETVQARQHGRR